MKKRQVKSVRKNSKPSADLETEEVGLTAPIPENPSINSYPHGLLNSLLLNEPQEHKDVTLIEQCLIKTNDSVALIVVYGPENK